MKSKFLLTTPSWATLSRYLAVLFHLGILVTVLRRSLFWGVGAVQAFVMQVAGRSPVYVCLRASCVLIFLMFILGLFWFLEKKDCRKVFYED